MLTSPRLTNFDALLGMLLLLFTAKVLAPDPLPDRAGAARDVDAGWRTAEARIVSRPLPTPRHLSFGSHRARMDAAARCLGLATAMRRGPCLRPGTAGCEAAGIEANDMAWAMHPGGRPGQTVPSLDRLIGHYAQAYTALAGPSPSRRWASSQLILTRDSAMCRTYQTTYEARLHDIPERQPR